MPEHCSASQAMALRQHGLSPPGCLSLCSFRQLKLCGLQGQERVQAAFADSSHERNGQTLPLQLELSGLQAPEHVRASSADSGSEQFDTPLEAFMTPAASIDSSTSSRQLDPGLLPPGEQRSSTGSRHQEPSPPVPEEHKVRPC